MSASIGVLRLVQAVMTGESVAGLLASTNRMCSKLVVENTRAGTALAITAATVLITLAATNYYKVVLCGPDRRQRIIRLIHLHSYA